LPLAQDPDTPGILAAIREDTSAYGMARWFVRDWPLGNGFYRPLTTLSLALDSALHGDDARGYRLTSWALAAVCALGVWWLMLLVSVRRGFATLAAVLFSLRQSGVFPLIGVGVVSVVAGVCLIALAAECVQGRRTGARGREGLARARSMVPLALLTVVVLEWCPLGVVTYWIAARTALLGALFSVYCLGCLAWFYRTGRAAAAVLVLVSGAAALASYEQAMVLPLVAPILAVGLGVRERRRRAAGLALLVGVTSGYMVLRLAVIGIDPSHYQVMQAKASLMGTVYGFGRYALRALPLAGNVWERATAGGVWAPADVQFWWALTMLAAWVASYARPCLVNARLFTALWAMKAVMFLPMAMLHPLSHYYYLPETVASGVAAGLLWPGGLRAPSPPDVALAGGGAEVSERVSANGSMSQSAT